MKKVIAKLVSLILCMTVLCCVLSACDWIAVNTDRNSSQIIASVKIDDAVDSEDIYKSELISGYMSYGYQYVYYYSKTESEAHQQVLDDLVQNKIIMQYARIELAKTYNANLSKSDAELTDFEKYFKDKALANKTPIDPRDNDISNLEKYLTEYERAEIYYNIRKDINELIDSYVDEEEETDSKENVTYEQRTAPTEKAEEEKTEGDFVAEVPTDDEYDIANVTLKNSDEDIKKNYKNKYDLDLAVFNTYKIDITSSNARRKAYNEMLQFLRDNGLISSDESVNYAENVDNVLKYTYFDRMLKTNIGSKIVEKFQDSLVTGTEAKLGKDGLWAEYLKDYGNQEALYKNDMAAYTTALEGASDTSFVLYNPLEGDKERQFGYVLNILIPFSSEQTAEIDAYKAEAGSTEAKRLELRAKLAKDIVAKDQRDSWVYSSNGTYNKDAKTFTFKDKYRTSETEIELLKNYIGEVVVKNADGTTDEDENGVEQTTWQFENVLPTKISMSDLFANYIKPITGVDALYFDENDSATVGKIELTEEKLNALKDLMYTFSTDTGCLGKEYGYVYSPISSNYVEEFTKASKAVVALGEGAYTTVLTDYGYHIVVCTKSVKTTYLPTDEGKAKFEQDLSDNNSLAYKYRKVKLDSVVDDEISKVSKKIVITNKDNDSKITYYPKTYKDLITE